MKKFEILLLFLFLNFLPIFLVEAQDLPEILNFPIPGRIEGKGTYFEIKNSEYLNIKLESSEEIEVILESIPKMISITIASSTAPSTQLSLLGLEPNKTYYKYEDSYTNGISFVSDENGSFSWQQDLTKPHHVWIQEIKSTIFIPFDPNDPNNPKQCREPYGIWDATTKTCTLTQDLAENVEITENDISLDCNNHSITGPDTGYGIYLNGKRGITIKNCTVTKFSYGIYLNTSSDNIISNNTVSSNDVGIEVYFSSNNNSLLNNAALNNYYKGIAVEFNSNGNVIANNIATSNTIYGILVYYFSNNNNLSKNMVSYSWLGIGLGYSSDNTLTNNTISNNSYNFSVYGEVLSHFLHNIDTSNKINGKSVQYLVNQKDLVIDSSWDVGYLGIINSTNITVKDLQITKNSQGILLAYSTNSKIENVTVMNNYYGIFLQGSDSNILINNKVLNNEEIGIRLRESSLNTVSNNYVSNNGDGIFVECSSNNLIVENTISNNKWWGISLYCFIGPMTNDLIYHNNFIENGFKPQAFVEDINELFDNGYPEGGNYWSDYKGEDLQSGPNQDQPGSDGIGDTPYCFSGGCDRYPFMKENGWERKLKVLISEVYYDVAKEKGEEGWNEWVIIHNLENENVNLSGWKICSRNSEERCNELSGEILAGGFAIITPTSTTFDFWKIPKDMTKIVLDKKFGSYGLANDGDNLILRNEKGEIVDAMSYGNDNSIFDPPCKNVKEGYSLLRFPPDQDTDTAKDFIESEPTIGKNHFPIPIIKFLPKNPVKGIEVKFDASSSTDPDGEIKNFEWQIASTTFSGTTTTFTFNENGEYKITLIVTDNDGATSSTSTIIKVEPFSFVIITDLHIGRPYREEYQGEEYYLTQRLRNVVNWINENKDKIQCENENCPIKFLVALGDITENAPLSAFCKTKEILDNLEIPYIPIFGNHDVGTDEEFENFGKWKGEDYFDQVFWSISSIPCQNATSTKNFETLLSEFNFQRDEKHKDYKNFAFSFGGINFIGLDFVSREKFMKIGPGVGADAVLNETNKTWLKEKLEEFKGEPIILFSHHPMKIEVPFSINAFSFFEWEELKKIINGNLVLFDFAGHIHSFEEVHGIFAPQNANFTYEPINNTQVLTTEALMVGSNGKGVENETKENGVKDGKKGIVRIVKVFDKENFDPYNWETTITPEEIRTEFVAFNPKIKDMDYEIICKTNACMEFESDFFTAKKFVGCWQIGDTLIGCGDNINFRDQSGKISCSGNYKELKCEFSEVPTTTSITLIAKSPESSFFEKISKTIEVKLNILPKIIKIAKDKIGKIFIESFTTGRNLIEKGRSFKDKVIAFIKHSPKIPVAIFEVDFEKAKEDIDLSNLIIDSDPNTQKAILYMKNWPQEIERSKILFLPIK